MYKTYNKSIINNKMCKKHNSPYFILPSMSPLKFNMRNSFVLLVFALFISFVFLFFFTVLNISKYLALKNKSPRGLNAHLNLRKLPVVHLGVCHQLEKLWGPPPTPPPPPWGHVYNLNNSESPTLKDAYHPKIA